jgi:hypothetical protein
MRVSLRNRDCVNDARALGSIARGSGDAYMRGGAVPVVEAVAGGRLGSWLMCGLWWERAARMLFVLDATSVSLLMTSPSYCRLVL